MAYSKDIKFIRSNKLNPADDNARINDDMIITNGNIYSVNDELNIIADYINIGNDDSIIKINGSSSSIITSELKFLDTFDYWIIK